MRSFDSSAIDPHRLQENIKRASSNQQIVVLERSCECTDHEAYVSTYYLSDV
jgi:hypothetical protein